MSRHPTQATRPRLQPQNHPYVQSQSHRIRPRPKLRIDTSTNQADDWTLGRARRISRFSVGNVDAGSDGDAPVYADDGAGASVGAFTLSSTTSSDVCSKREADDRVGVGMRRRRRRGQGRQRQKSGAGGIDNGKGRMRGESEEEGCGWEVDLEAGRAVSSGMNSGVASGLSRVESAAFELEWTGSQIQKEGEEEHTWFLSDSMDLSAHHYRLQQRRKTIYKSRHNSRDFAHFWNTLDALHDVLRRAEDLVADALWAFRTTGLRLADRVVEWIVECIIGFFDVEEKSNALIQMVKNSEGQSEDEEALLGEEDEEASLYDDNQRHFDDMAASSTAKSNGGGGGVLEPGWGWLGRWTVVERLYLEGMRQVEDKWSLG